MKDLNIKILHRQPTMEREKQKRRWKKKNVSEKSLYLTVDYPALSFTPIKFKKFLLPPKSALSSPTILAMRESTLHSRSWAHKTASHFEKSCLLSSNTNKDPCIQPSKPILFSKYRIRSAEFTSLFCFIDQRLGTNNTCTAPIPDWKNMPMMPVFRE